jgi:hypothetical protein
MTIFGSRIHPAISQDDSFPEALRRFVQPRFRGGISPPLQRKTVAS